MSKVLMISTDRKVFEKGSPVRKRMEEYGTLVDELHVIVFSLKRHRCTQEQLTSSVWLYPTNVSWRWQYILRAVRIARSLPSVDVVTTQDPFETGLAGYSVARRGGAKLHVQLHTDPWSPQFSRTFSVLNMIRKAIMHGILPKADCVRVTTRRLKEVLQNRYGASKKIAVLPIFVDVQRYRTTEPDAELVERYRHWDHTLLVVSRLEKEKKVIDALQALHRVCEAGMNAGLIILGSGSQESALREYVQRYSLEEHVDFVGYTDAAPYYKVADITLVPSAYEGYGMVIVESLAAGTSVLARDVGVAQEAGAVVADSDTYEKELIPLLKEGVPEGVLQNYPYKNKEEYLAQLRQSILCST